ncbi:glutamine ABC transporter substrate-binding protein [Helicobacter aurati]|uniref:Glutamine ABC transporter substrate-binding protein n=1 Tax=Helicobacter aurati TaxID=137778 RepID=A0A3D8JA81_9HELI|nr:cysteine ABC transporter substrate-binding protein [Helicobacter aurati]RDU73784.1 glutamine ABC transporter substrate-binding protein [Helicobacter aurati]
MQALIVIFAKKLHAFFVYSFLLCVVSFFVACENSSQNNKDAAQTVSAIETIKQRGVLRVGVFSDKPPFGYINAQGEYDGFDVFIAKRIAKDLLGDESKIEFIPVEAAARIPALQANKVDIIMANFTQTKERERQVLFAKPYMKVSLGVVSKNGAITDVEQLRGKKLIVNKGTTADMYFTKNTAIGLEELLKFDQNTETFQSFLQGKADALSHDSTLLFAWVKENPDYKVGITELGDKDQIAPAVKKENKDLLEWLNNEITKLQHERFFEQAYTLTLAPAFGSDITSDMVIFTD